MTAAFIVAILAITTTWRLKPSAPESIEPAQWTLPAPVSQDYVGTKVCHECHDQIAEQYSEHPMSRSFGLATAARAPTAGEPSDAEFVKADGRRYRVEQTATGLLHHESVKTDAGETIYDQSAPVKYVLGSGQRGRSYVVERDGWLFLSPISWYSSRKLWDLSPQYDPQSHPRFERKASSRCIACHAGRANFDPETPDRFGSPALVELSIGCERCHGPGKQHVVWQRGDAEAREGNTDPIVNPARLKPALRDAVCNQCHLAAVDEVLRFGRADGDFRPGMAVGYVWTVFTNSSAVRDAVSQVQQMHSSACFQKSEGALGCISCHDPHRIPQPQDRSEFYRAKCLACHQQQGCRLPDDQRRRAPAQGSCMHCHMPRLNAQDVPHTTQTDHRVLRRPDIGPAPDEGHPSPDELSIFDNEEAETSPLEEQRARGLLWIRRAEQTQGVRDARRGEELLIPVLEVAPRDVDVLDALALAAALQNQPELAIEMWTTALELSPKSELLLQSLSLQYQGASRADEALALVERMLELNPWSAETHARKARLLMSLGRAKDAVPAARRGLELNPAQPAGYFALADLLERTGDAPQAQQIRDKGRLLETVLQRNRGEQR